MLALGEPTHGEEVLLDVRNEHFRDLVERAGYRTIAIESDCLLGLIVDDYVTTGAGDLDDVMRRGFSHGFGAAAGNRDLVRWMRAYNEGRPAEERVRFAGFDGPLEITHAESPRAAFRALHEYLRTGETYDELLGSDERWTNPEAMMDPTRSIGRGADADRLRLLADDLVALVDERAPEASSIDDYEKARLYGRTVTGLLRYHSWLADTSPDRMSRLLGVRDSMMAANLLALAERGPVLVHAHNAHLQRDRSSMKLGDVIAHWWSAGSIVGARLGAEYAFLATAVGTIAHHGVPAPPADSLEGLLYAQPGDHFLADPRELTGQSLAPRASEWFGYAPLDPAHLPAYDGVVFVRACTSS